MRLRSKVWDGHTACHWLVLTPVTPWELLHGVSGPANVALYHRQQAVRRHFDQPSAGALALSVAFRTATAQLAYATSVALSAARSCGKHQDQSSAMRRAVKRH